MREIDKRFVQVVPSQRQVAYQQLELLDARVAPTMSFIGVY